MLLQLLEGLGFVTAAVVSIVGAIISIRNRKQDTHKIESETNLNETQQASIVKQITISTEKMYLDRLDSFKDDIKILRDELSSTREELTAVRSEAGLLEDFFFNKHQEWDRKIVAQAREKGWDIEDPPSWLAFLREKSNAP